MKKRKQRNKFKLVTDFNIDSYRCGLKVGDRVRLLSDLVMRYSDETPTGVVYKKGEVWTVLRGAKSTPRVVWFRQANGNSHTWDDDNTIFEMFELVTDS